MASRIDFSNIKSMKNTGADLTQYSLELQNERNTRSLTLRRSNRPSIACVMKKGNRGTLIDPTKYPFLNPDVAVQILASNNAQKISEFSTNILTTSAASPNLLSSLANSSAVCEALCEVSSSENTEQVLVSIMNVIAAIFPLAGAMKEAYIDGGIICSIMNYLQSDSKLLACNSILLIKSLCDASVYARDSVLTFGIHTMLIELALAQTDETVVVDACRTISSVFETKEPIETTILTDSVKHIVHLLSLPYVNAVSAILQTLVSITTNCATVIFDIFASGVVPSIIGMIDVPELAHNALSLIGNLAIYHPAHVQTMFDADLIEKLLPLLETEFAGDAFFVFSNLTACVPSIMIPIFTNEFIDSAVELAQTSSFNIQKEVVFFLATFLTHVEIGDVMNYMKPDIIDLIIEMLESGVSTTILSCFNVIQRIAMIVKADSSKIEIVSEEQWEDLIGSLTELTESSSVLVREKAIILLGSLSSIEEK